MSPAWRLRPRFTLSSLFAFITALSVLLAWLIWSREQAHRIQGLRERERYALAVLWRGTAHTTVIENELLWKHRLYPSVRGVRSESIEPGEFTFEADILFESSTERRSEWPVLHIKEAVLSSLVDVFKDMDVFSSVDITAVTPDCALVAGDEGWIVWEFVGLEKGLPSTSGSLLHSLTLEFKCRGKLTYKEPFAEPPQLYKLGEKPELALHSSKAEDRRAGAAHISIRHSRDNMKAVLAAIDRETDPEVLSRLFQTLELDQPTQNGVDALVLARLRKMLDQGGRHAPLAARTIVRGYQLFRLFNFERDQWTTAALHHFHRACIEILESGKSEHWTAAVRELRRQMSPNDKEAVEAMIAAIKSGQTRPQTNVELYQALRGNPHAVDPLFKLIHEDDRPKVWHPAAELLRASDGFNDTNGEKVRDRIQRLSGEPKYRMQVVGGYSLGYKDELNALGDDAFEFLVPLLKYRIWENVPELYRDAAGMLAELGDKRAVSVLVRAVEDHFQHGNLDASYTAYGAAQLVKAINKLTGEDFGGLGIGRDLSGDEVENCDWTEIRRALAAYSDKPHSGH